MRTKIEISKLAKIVSASIYLDDFLLFVGDNNSGKTLLMELLYGIIDLVSKWKNNCNKARITEQDNVKYIQFANDWFRNVEDELNRYLHINKEQFVLNSFFNSIPLESVQIKFEDTEELFYIGAISEQVSLEKQYPNGERETIFEEDYVSEDIEDELAHKVLLDMIGIHGNEKQLFVPAARAGLQMLYRYFFVISGSANPGMPLAVFEYLKFMQTYASRNDFTENEKDLLDFLEQKVIKGKVEFENNEFIFCEGENKIPLNYASSMIHEVAVLTSILKSNNQLKYIYYDEVENSVHPLMQGKVASALIRLCNLGKKIIISTHSDTMAGKINNLILLSKMKNMGEKRKKINKIGLTVSDMLAENKTVMVYEFRKDNDDKVRVEPLEFMEYPQVGYCFERFNENIDQLYNESNYIMEDDEN